MIPRGKSQQPQKLSMVIIELNREAGLSHTAEQGVELLHTDKEVRFLVCNCIKETGLANLCNRSVRVGKSWSCRL